MAGCFAFIRRALQAFQRKKLTGVVGVWTKVQQKRHTII